MKKIILSIEGMTCSACSSGLEKYLNKQNGIRNAMVNLVMANASIEYDETILTEEQVSEFIKEAGFKSLGEFKELKVEKKAHKEKQKMILFTIIALIFLYSSMGYMFKIPIPKEINPYEHALNYAIWLLCLTIPFLIYGLDILKNGYKNFIHKTPNMDSLVGVGVISSLLYSGYSIIQIVNGNPEYFHTLYFDSVAIVIYFIKLGRYLEGISTDKTKDAIQKLVKITPNKARIKVDGKEKEGSIDEVQKGDILISKPGEKIAVDGEILFGQAHMDESFITGESKLSSKTKGSKVIAGSINYDGYLEYKAEKIGKDSTISQIVRLVIEASNSKPPIAKVADTIASYFVPFVFLIASLTFGIYVVAGANIADALSVFVTILVVACPCSLGLATPLATVVSEGLCAHQGIFVKRSELLELLPKIKTIVFDKTGTLTYGTLKIAEIKNNSSMDTKKILQIAGSMEEKSTHPIKHAFIKYLEENKIPIIEGFEVENLAGLGIKGTLNNDQFLLGNSKLLKKYHIKNPYVKEESKLAKKGNSIVYIVQNQKILALIGVNDIKRPEAKEVIEALNAQNIQTVMLTGDNAQTSQKIAKEIGITTVIANVFPKEKASIIKKLKEENGPVLMCGDGINDSPALASADIGVSVAGATDIARDSSDIILTSQDLKSILAVLDISKKTMKTIKQNLFWAFFYNTLMIPIAMGILRPWKITINPMLASFAMVFSSITVILNTLRLKK